MAFVVAAGFASSKNGEWIAEDYRSKAIKVDVQTLPVDLTGVKVSGGCGRGGCYWSDISTEQWVFFASADAFDCGQFFRHFVQHHQIKRFEMPYREVTVITQGINGKTIPLSFYVPRFEKAPEHLPSCQGFSYDEQTKTVKKGAQTVAFLFHEQPALKLPK